MDRYEEDRLVSDCQDTPDLGLELKHRSTLQQPLHPTFAKSIYRTSERVDYLEETVAQVQNTIEDDRTSIHVELDRLTRNQNHQVLLIYLPALWKFLNLVSFLFQGQKA